MVKPIKKIQFWCSHEQCDYIKKSPYLLLKEIQFYKISDDILFCSSIKADAIHFENTLKFYRNNHLDAVVAPFLKQVKKSLSSIVPYDVVFRLEKENYLFHTYKVLGFIMEAVSAYTLSQDKQFVKGTIADYGERKKDYYKREYLDNRRQAFKPNNINKGSNLLSAFLYRSLFFCEEFTKHFLAYFSLLGIDNIKLLQNDKYESLMIKRTLKVFQSGRVDVDDCAKSLLSILYYYFIFKMKMPKGKALSNARYIVDSVFDKVLTYSGSELIKNVYVKEVIGSLIVYSFHKTNKYLTSENKEYLHNVFTNSSIIDMTQFPQQLIKHTLNNPLFLHSLRTPLELLQEI
jgi:hypothetical protein